MVREINESNDDFLEIKQEEIKVIEGVRNQIISGGGEGVTADIVDVSQCELVVIFYTENDGREDIIKINRDKLTWGI